MEHTMRFTSYKGLMKYLNLKITSNMRLTPPRLDQNANYNATLTKFLADK